MNSSQCAKEKYTVAHRFQEFECYSQHQLSIKNISISLMVISMLRDIVKMEHMEPQTPPDAGECSQLLRQYVTVRVHHVESDPQPPALDPLPRPF